MAIICQQIATISGINSLVCGKLIKIYDIRPWYGVIDVLIEGQVSPQVGTTGNAFTIGSERFEIKLISKNVAAGTAIVQLTISNVYVPPPPVTEVTHYLDLYLKPYSWYSTGGAVDSIVARLGDLNGAFLNLFSSVGITDYHYVGTSVLIEPDKPGIVTIRIKLSQTVTMGIESMAIVIPLAAWIAAIVVAGLLVVFFVGVITGWSFTLSGVIGQITGKKYSGDEVVTIVNDVVKKQLAECNKNYADPNTGVGCQKAVICGAANGLTDALKLTGTDCTTLDINPKIDACLAAYNIDKDKAKYDICIGKIADDAGAKAKAALPQTTDWTTLALIGLGAVAVISLSKGSQSPVVIQERAIQERAIHEKSLRERGQ